MIEANDKPVVGVLGANGFIGRHLVRRLAEHNIAVVAFGRGFPPDYADSIGHPVDMRLMNIDHVLETHALLQGITTVVQLINSSSPGMANHKVTADLSVNVLPHVACIESCIMAGVKQFVFLSSGGTIYGNPLHVPITEDHPTKPLNSYGMTKLVVEQYLEMLATGSQMYFASLRVSNPFGPGQANTKGQGLIPTILGNHHRGIPLKIFGDGASLRDYLYIDDLMDAILAVIARPTISGAINIGSGVGRSILGVVGALEAALGQTVAVEFADARPTDARSNVLDPTRANALLKWRAATLFEDGIARTVESWNS